MNTIFISRFEILSGSSVKSNNPNTSIMIETVPSASNTVHIDTLKSAGLAAYISRGPKSP